MFRLVQHADSRVRHHIFHADLPKRTAFLCSLGRFVYLLGDCYGTWRPLHNSGAGVHGLGNCLADGWTCVGVVSVGVQCRCAVFCIVMFTIVAILLPKRFEGWWRVRCLVVRRWENIWCQSHQLEKWEEEEEAEFLITTISFRCLFCSFIFFVPRFEAIKYVCLKDWGHFFLAIFWSERNFFAFLGACDKLRGPPAAHQAALCSVLHLTMPADLLGAACLFITHLPQALREWCAS